MPLYSNTRRATDIKKAQAKAPAKKTNFTTKAINGYKDYERTQNNAALAQDVSDWSNAAVASRMGGGGYAPASGGGGYSSGGGGGGGRGGGSDPYLDYQKQRDEELRAYKAQLEARLNEMKAAVPGALAGYLNDYNSRIAQIAAQNAGLVGQYGNDIHGVLNGILSQSNAAGQALQRDLSAQGADGRALGMQQMFNQNANTAMAGQGDIYNQRLAQIQAMANADRQSMGAGINQAGQGQLENSYLSALMQIQAMGR
jgi:hypothetical protein